MADRPIKVSVIVPCYNVEKFLPQCLDSLVGQTLEDIEIICVNDASPDNGIDILRRYERAYPGKVIVIDLKENQRQGGARNEGIRRARGEYVGFVDSDDWVTPDMYESLYAVAHIDDVDIVEGNIFNSKGRSMDGAAPGTGAVHGGLLTDEDRARFLVAEGVIGTVCSVHRRSMLIENDLMFPSHLFFEDMVWKPLEMMIAKSYYKVDKLFYCYCHNADSVTQKKTSPHHYDRLRMYPLLLSEAKKRGLYDRFKDEIDFRFIFIYYIQPLYRYMDVLLEIELDKLYEMRLFMIKNMPDYKSNPYLGHDPEKTKWLSKTLKKIKGFNHVAMSLLDADPALAFEYLKMMKR